MTHRGLGFHHICSQRPTPVLSTSAYFNKFAVLARTYSVCVVNSVRSRVPSFIPSYSDRVRVRVSFLSLSQFYGSRNPRAPVFVVCLCSCLLAQRCSGASSLTVVICLPTAMVHLIPSRTNYMFYLGTTIVDVPASELVFEHIYKIHGLPKNIISNRDVLLPSGRGSIDC